MKATTDWSPSPRRGARAAGPEKDHDAVSNGMVEPLPTPGAGAATPDPQASGEG